MTITIHRILLWALSAFGAGIGICALFFPGAFYSEFPGFGMRWVSVDGPFNEHLIRDVGAFYLALSAGGLIAALSKKVEGARAIGVAWVVFSAPHVAYHVAHLNLLPANEAMMQVFALSSTLVLALPLLLPTTNQRQTAVHRPSPTQSL